MRRWVAFCVGLGLFSLVVALPTTLALTDPASPRMEYWNGLFMQIFWIALVVGILVWALLVYAIIRFRARKGGPKEGPHIHGNTKMEIAWTIAPALVMGWLLVVSFNGLFAIDNGPPHADTTIKITAQQFTFNFEYEDGTGGSSPSESIFIEQNKYVMFDITAVDVIHAFSVPELGLMKDAIPGRINHDWVQATKPGNYSIKCRELCGAGHSLMVGQIVVFPEGANGGKAYGNPEAAGGSPAATPPTTNSTSPSPTNSTANVTIPEGAKELEVKLATTGFNIEPTKLTADVGSVVFDVTNAGDVVHNFYVGLYDKSKPDDGALWKTGNLQGGQAEKLVATFDKDAVYEYWCNIQGHRFGAGQGMSGFITVGKGGAIDLGPKPLLPGFELYGLLFALAVVGFAVRRRRKQA